MLGQLTRQQEPDSGLNLPGRDGGPLVVLGQPGGLAGHPSEDVVDKAVHDGHGFGGDAGVGVDLLEDLVDVDGEGLFPLGLSLGLFVRGGGLFDGLFGAFGGSHGWVWV